MMRRPPWSPRTDSRFSSTTLVLSASLLSLRHDRTSGTPGSCRSFGCLLASVARGSAISRSDKAEGGALRIDAVECEFAAGDFHRPIDHFATAGFDRADGPVDEIGRAHV